jgi:hypothetical protein
MLRPAHCAESRHNQTFGPTKASFGFIDWAFADHFPMTATHTTTFSGFISGFT